MTPELFKAEMERISNDSDTCEKAHIAADDAMCEARSEAGYSDGVRVFRAMRKYYGQMRLL